MEKIKMSQEIIRYKNNVSGLSACMLFLAVSRLPYGYYILLRWVVTASALFVALVSYKIGKKFWIFLMGLIMILFNPIIPVHLNKKIWMIIDSITGILFIVFIIRTNHD
jgi:hypothetical protein